MTKALKSHLIQLSGAADNSNTTFYFDFNDAAKICTKLYHILLLPEIVAACQAEDYKPLMIIQNRVL